MRSQLISIDGFVGIPWVVSLVIFYGIDPMRCKALFFTTIYGKHIFGTFFLSIEESQIQAPRKPRTKLGTQGFFVAKNPGNGALNWEDKAIQLLKNRQFDGDFQGPKLIATVR